jgi:hypothetical protein
VLVTYKCRKCQHIAIFEGDDAWPRAQAWMLAHDLACKADVDPTGEESRC